MTTKTFEFPTDDPLRAEWVTFSWPCRHRLRRLLPWHPTSHTLTLQVADPTDEHTATIRWDALGIFSLDDR